jgi:hypothetical protein
VPGQREAGREAEPEQERGPEEERPVGQPGEVEQRRDEGEAERHGDEGLAEARPADDRRQVAVEQPAERQLEGVLGPEQERRDPDLDHGDGADSGHEEEAPLGGGRKRAPENEEAEAEAAHEQGEREEVRPADDVLRPRRPGRSVGLGRRRSRVSDSEREHAGDDVPVARENVPAHRVRPLGQPAERRHDVVPAAPALGLPRHELPAGGSHLHRAGHDRDDLVEVQPHDGRRALEALLELWRGVLEGGVGERARRERECGERRSEAGDAPHRCGVPASDDRCPKIGARSRSQ